MFKPSGHGVNDPNGGRSECTAAYTTAQISRLIMGDGLMGEISTIAVKEIVSSIFVTKFNTWQLHLSHFRGFQKVMMERVNESSTEGFCGTRGTKCSCSQHLQRR